MICVQTMVTRPTNIVLNQVTLVAQGAPVTFGHVNSQIYMNIYLKRERAQRELIEQELWA
jgi:hypothetical protein